MIWDLPLYVEIDGEHHAIRNKCDYRVVLDVISALNDDELTKEEKVKCALFIFYEDFTKIADFQVAIDKMMNIISLGETDAEENTKSPKLMDWEQDFKHLAPPIARVLGYDPRTPEKLTHWYSFIGAFQEIGECNFSTISNIRSKKAKGKKLDKWEEEYYRNHKKDVDLKNTLTAEEQAWLDADW